MACGYIFCSLWRYYSKFTSKKSISFFLRRVLCYEPHELEIPDYINRVPPWLANIPFICLDQLCPGSWVSENLLSYFSSWSASSLRPLPLLSWGLRPHLEYVVCGRLLSKRVGTQPFFPFLASIPMSVSCRGCLDRSACLICIGNLTCPKRNSAFTSVLFFPQSSLKWWHHPLPHHSFTSHKRKRWVVHL